MPRVVGFFLFLAPQKEKDEKQMTDLKCFLPTPHPTKAICQRHRIPLAAVAQAIERSYGYVSNILAGNQPATPEVDAKLHQLANSLEDRTAR